MTKFVIFIVAVLATAVFIYFAVFRDSKDIVFSCPACGDEELLPLSDGCWWCRTCEMCYGTFQLRREKKKPK